MIILLLIKINNSTSLLLKKIILKNVLKLYYTKLVHAKEIYERDIDLRNRIFHVIRGITRVP